MSEFTKQDARIAHSLGVSVEPGPIDIPKPDEDAAFLSLVEAYDRLAVENARLWCRVRDLESSPYRRRPFNPFSLSACITLGFLGALVVMALAAQFR